MRRMYTVFIRPSLDYCSQLWSPEEGPPMDKLEKVQSNFTKLIPSIRNLEYHERLKAMKITSLQRRYERYKIFYIKKILSDKVPNIGIGILHDFNHRNGLILETMNPKCSNLRKATFQFSAPRIFNKLPKDLRNFIGSYETFKIHLDSFLDMIPDIPRICMGTKHHSNSLESMLSQWKWSLRNNYPYSESTALF